MSTDCQVVEAEITGKRRAASTVELSKISGGVAGQTCALTIAGVAVEGTGIALEGSWVDKFTDNAGGTVICSGGAGQTH